MSFDEVKNLRLFGALQSLTPEAIKDLQDEAEFNKRVSPRHHKLGCLLSRMKRDLVVSSVLAQRVGKPA
jgi:hypothetical protein